LLDIDDGVDWTLSASQPSPPKKARLHELHTHARDDAAQCAAGATLPKLSRTYSAPHAASAHPVDEHDADRGQSGSEAASASAPAAAFVAAASFDRPRTLRGTALQHTLRTLIRSQVDLYARVLLFQPIDVMTVVWALLTQCGVRASVGAVRAALDSEGVCTVVKLDRVSGGGPMAPPAARKRRRKAQG
jgi:hypothetical protein